MKFNLSCSIFVIYFVGLHALQEQCSDDSDCSSQNAVCLNQQCQCDNLSYSSSNNSLCLSYVTEYQGICYEDEQCEWVGSNSSCINNQCMCKEGYRWYKGKCQTYSPKGGACNKDDDCYDGYNMLALTCKSSECKCSSGYYDRGGDCRVESRIFLECAINSDCKPFLFVFTSTCGLGKCKNSDSSNTTSAAQKLNKNINNAVIMEKNAGCMNQTSVSSSLVSDMSQISSEEECKSKYHNTKWFKNATCICEPGFFLYNGTCTAELGMLDPNVNYTSDSDCPLKPGKLKNKVCYCKDYWFYDDNNRECIKTTLEMTRSCLTNEWCRAMGPYAFCNSTTSQCQCNSFATYNNETAYCEKSENETISVCLKNSNCPINERCLDEQCACVENFSRSEDGTCLPDIGGSCAFRSCSHIGNSSCVNEVCTCDDNFIGSNTTCYPVAGSLGTTCEIDEQCEKLQNSGCRTSSFDSMYNTSIKTCICNDGYSDINGTCYQTRKYGDLCSTRLDCTIVLNESFECRNNLCQCPVNYQLVDGYCSSGCFTIRTSLSLMLLSVVLVLVF